MLRLLIETDAVSIYSYTHSFTHTLTHSHTRSLTHIHTHRSGEYQRRALQNACGARATFQRNTPNSSVCPQKNTLGKHAKFRRKKKIKICKDLMERREEEEEEEVVEEEEEEEEEFTR